MYKYKLYKILFTFVYYVLFLDHVWFKSHETSTKNLVENDMEWHFRSGPSLLQVFKSTWQYIVLKSSSFMYIILKIYRDV